MARRQNIFFLNFNAEVWRWSPEKNIFKENHCASKPKCLPQNSPVIIISFQPNIGLNLMQPWYNPKTNPDQNIMMNMLFNYAHLIGYARFDLMHNIKFIE